QNNSPYHLMTFSYSRDFLHSEVPFIASLQYNRSRRDDMFILPKNVTIIEVGPRDGLQNEKNYVEETEKVRFIHALQESGIEEMELTSFVSPKWVPQLADAKNIVKKSVKNGRQFVL